MPGSSRWATTLTRRKRPYQDIADTNESPVTPSASDSELLSVQPARSAETPTSNGSGPKKMAYIVGLDFGTTMTSVSYCRFKSGTGPPRVTHGQIKDITHWPGAGRDQQRGEVPSESLYLNGVYYWGYEASQALEQFHCSGGISDATGRLIRFTKLLLSDADKTEEDDKDSRFRDVRETLSHLGKTVHDAVKDYLVEVFRYTKKYLEDQAKFTESSEVEISLSFPAGWSIEASWSFQRLVGEAAASVAFGQISGLFIVNEPEAASAFALKDMVGDAHVSVSNIPFHLHL